MDGDDDDDDKARADGLGAAVGEKETLRLCNVVLAAAVLARCSVERGSKTLRTRRSEGTQSQERTQNVRGGKLE